MDSDFGLLVDFLHGELSPEETSRVQRRLDDDETFRERLQSLRRTFRVLRSLPPLGASQPAAVESEIDGRFWAEILPMMTERPEYLAALRLEFGVRDLTRCLPMLNASEGFVSALRHEFNARALGSELPEIKARPELIRDLRLEFVTRATLDQLPCINVTDAFRERVRTAIMVASTTSMLPELRVREGFRDRLVNALQSVEPEQAPQSDPTPTLEASDPLRRRIFRKVLMASRRGPREEPSATDVNDYTLGRSMRRGFQRARAPLGATLAIHAIAFAVMFFVFVDVPETTRAESIMANLNGTEVPLPPDPPDHDASVLDDSDVSNWPHENPRDIPFISRPSDVGLGGPIQLPSSNDDENTTDKTPRPDRIRKADEMTLSDVSMRRNSAAWLRLRDADRRTKIQYLGSEKLYEALDNALYYLQRTQQPDGGWGHIDVVTKPRSSALRDIQRLELTSAAVLAFLGDGHNSKRSSARYDGNVRDGLKYLLDQQRNNGRIGPDDNPIVLGHAMATLALLEDFGMTRDQNLKTPIKRAVKWLVEVEDLTLTGGFPYRVGQRSSLTTSVWAFMALSMAKKLRVPGVTDTRLTRLLDWYEDTTRSGKILTDTDEVLAENDLLPTAASGALACFATDRGYDNRSRRFLNIVRRNAPALDPTNPQKGRSDMRYVFFASLGDALTSGTNSSAWRHDMGREMLKHQISSGAKEGSFDPTGDYANLYGRVLETALAALSIENAYRITLHRD